MPKVCDMGPTALLPFWRKACWGFFRPEKSWWLRPGLNPWTWVLKGSTLPLDHGSHSYVALSINGFLDCVHHPIFNKEYNILQTWSVPTLKWKGAETPTWLDLKEKTIISHWTERVTALFALVLVFNLQCVVPTVLVDCVWNVMAHGQKLDFVSQRNGRVHLSRPVGVSSVDYWQLRCAHQQK